MHDTMLKVQFLILNSAKDKKINEKKMKAIKLQKCIKLEYQKLKTNGIKSKNKIHTTY